MKGLYILVTDSKRALIVSDFSTWQLPCHLHWPAARPPLKNGWPAAILKHVTYGHELQWPAVAKQKKVFGQPKSSTWYLCEISEDFLDSLVRQARMSRIFWQRHASATVPWTLKAVPLDHAVKLISGHSSNCVVAYLLGSPRPQGLPINKKNARD
jgi:hypothetical protein